MAWRPINRGLSQASLDVIAEARPLAVVHLFLVATDDERHTRTACGRGLGEWITGKAEQVTCTACQEWAHA